MTNDPATSTGTATTDREPVVRVAAAIPADVERPRPPGPLAACAVHTWRAALVFRRAPGRLFEAVVMPFMFLLTFTYLFGGAIAGSSGTFLQYFVPGISVMTVFIMTVNAGTVLNVEVSKGIFDRYRTLPYWQPAKIIGQFAADVVRYGFAMVATMLLGLLLGYRPPGGIAGILLAWVLLLVFAFGVGWIFAFLGLLVPGPDMLTQTSMIVLFPLSFVSNIFIRPETMPSWLRAIADVNPVSFTTTAVRGALDGQPSGVAILVMVAASAVLTAVFAPLTMRLYRRRR